MRAVHDTIENRVGQRRITQVLMPAITGELARDDRGPPAIAVVEDLQQVLALGVFEADKSQSSRISTSTRAKRASTIG